MLHNHRMRPAFLALSLLTVFSLLLGACATPTPQIIRETVVVKETVPVEKIVQETVVVKETVAVEKVVKETVVVEKQVTPVPGAMTYRGYTAPATKYPDGTSVIYMAGMSIEQKQALTEDAKWLKQATNIDLHIELGDDAKFNALVAAGTPPDLYYCNTPGIQAADGTFMPIDEYVDKAFLARLPQQVVDGFVGLDGKLYSIQASGWFPVTLVNTKMLESVGEKLTGADWTWDDVVRIGQKLTKDSNGKTAADSGFDPDKAETWGFWAGWFADDILPFSNGARRFDETGTRSLVDDPKFMEAWKWWADLTTTYQVMPPNAWLGAAGQSASQLFLAGKLAMFSEGISYDLFRQANEKLGEGNWKIMAYPHPKTHDLVLARYQGAACVSSKTKNPAATVEALKFISVAGLPTYPPLWLKDADVVSYWESQFPFLKAAGYRDAMEFSLARIGPEPWNGKAAPFNIDRYTQGWDFWAQWGQVRDGKLAFDKFDFAGYAKQANQKVVEGMEKDLQQANLLPAWKDILAKLLAQRKADLNQ